MTAGGSGAPVFFLDRSLGRVQVPRLLRAAGLTVITLAEHYGTPSDESVTDVEWLELAGRRNWPVLMKDARIRYRQQERAVLLQSGVQAFLLTNANLKADQMAEEFTSALDQILDAVATQSPCLYSVRQGRIQRLDLS